MATRARRDWTVEEFDEWCDARQRVAETLEASGEEGGPTVSLVPNPRTVPLEVPPDDVMVTVAPPSGVVPFKAEPSRNSYGWSAERQRIFIEALAETGTVHLAARSAGLSARSAYGLRVRSVPFAAAWDAAQQLAVGRLSALAFDRAIHGRIEQVFHEGDLVGEKRIPSERLLMWLLARLDPKRFAAPWERRRDDISDPQVEAKQAFPSMLDALTDIGE